MPDKMDGLLKLSAGEGAVFYETLAMYGILVEEVNDTSSKSFLGDVEFQVKFSIPESWEVEPSNEPIIKDFVVAQFKEKFSSFMTASWLSEDDSMDEDDAEELMQYFKYFCRVRKGETYTIETREKSLESVRHQLEQVQDYVEQRSGFEEV